MLFRLLLIFSFIFFNLSCSHVKQDHSKTTLVNSEEALKAPYVLMISIDGYRHDYNRLHKPNFLRKFEKKSTKVKSLQATFPTKTFPNHYSIVTGMYPGNHQIVANYFYAPDLKASYSLKDKKSVRDARFYGGIPLWNLAVQNGMVSATYYWPGSEAPINGYRPTYWEKYDHHKPHLDRINKVIDWFKLPASKRPHFVTLYFSDVDSAGHKYGPTARETKAAVHKVDKTIETLVNELEKLSLPLNIVIVSDHGMTEMSKKRAIYFKDIFTSTSDKSLLNQFKNIGYGPLVHFYYQGKASDKEKATRELVKVMNRNAKKHKAFLRKNLPKKFFFTYSVRAGDVVAIADMGWSLGPEGHWIGGGKHGFDNFDGKDMHGIFYAVGPNFKSNYRLPTMSNVHIYPALAEILNLPVQHKIDGDLKKIKKALK